MPKKYTRVKGVLKEISYKTWCMWKFRIKMASICVPSEVHKIQFEEYQYRVTANYLAMHLT